MGERREWFKLASHLHLTVQELQEKTTSTEFLEWRFYLREALNEFHREDYYLAQIALEIRRSWASTNRKLSDFLITFSTEEKKAVASSPQKREKTEEEKKAYLARSKAAWLGALGIKL